VRAWACCGLRYFTEDEGDVVVVLFRRSMSCHMSGMAVDVVEVIIKIKKKILDRGLFSFFFF